MILFSHSNVGVQEGLVIQQESRIDDENPCAPLVSLMSREVEEGLHLAVWMDALWKTGGRTWMGIAL